MRFMIPGFLAVLSAAILTCAASRPGPAVTVRAAVAAGQVRIITTYTAFSVQVADSIVLIHSSGLFPASPIRRVQPAGSRTADTLIASIRAGESGTGSVCANYVRGAVAGPQTLPTQCPTWTIANPLAIPGITVRADTLP